MGRNNKKTIIVGDIHGLLDELEELLEKCEFVPNTDRLIFVGDLVDRGPKSAEVIDFAIRHNVEMTVGNHDEKYIKYNKHYQKARVDKNYKIPMKLKPEKAKVWETLSEEHLNFLSKQPCYIHIPEYNSFIVHAGVLPDKPITDQGRHVYLYTRYVCEKTLRQMHLGPNFTQPRGSVHWTELYSGTKDIIYGHDVKSTTEPTIKRNKNGGRTVGIDTGACFGGRLTAIVFSKEFKRGEIVQVQSKYSYKDYKIVQPR